jgi:hypothetical protein
VKSFISRLRLLVSAQGRSISQYLSSHLTRGFPTDAAPDPDFRPFSREEGAFIAAHINFMGNKLTRISQLFSEQFGARDPLAVNWLIRDTENVFLQNRLTLPPIDEILSFGAGLGRRGGSESPFDPCQFFAGRPFELSIE